MIDHLRSGHARRTDPPQRRRLRPLAQARRPVPWPSQPFPAQLQQLQQPQQVQDRPPVLWFLQQPPRDDCSPEDARNMALHGRTPADVRSSLPLSLGSQSVQHLRPSQGTSNPGTANADAETRRQINMLNRGRLS